MQMKTPLTLFTVLLFGFGLPFPQIAFAADPFAKWEKSIAAFEQADKQQAPPSEPVLFIGSSSIRLWDVATSFPGLNTLNRGFGGSTIADSSHFFDRIIKPYQPKVIVLYAGDNDISKGLSPQEVFEDFKSLAQKISVSLPGTPLIYIAIKPSIKRKNLWPEMKQSNDLIAKFCAQQPNLEFADIAKPMLDNPAHSPAPELFRKDGLHLSAQGYQLWKETLLPLIEPHLSTGSK